MNAANAKFDHLIDLEFDVRSTRASVEFAPMGLPLYQIWGAFDVNRPHIIPEYVFFLPSNDVDPDGRRIFDLDPDQTNPY